MSSYSQSYSQTKGSNLSLGNLPQAFRERYPTMASVLCGEKGEGTEYADPAKATICIFEDAGRLKFSLNPKFGSKVAFGTFRDGLGGFQELEEQLLAGAFEWKICSGRKNSSTAKG